MVTEGRGEPWPGIRPSAFFVVSVQRWLCLTEARVDPRNGRLVIRKPFICLTTKHPQRRFIPPDGFIANHGAVQPPKKCRCGCGQSLQGRQDRKTATCGVAPFAKRHFEPLRLP